MICETKFSKNIESGQLPQDLITNRNDLICKITYVAFGKQKYIYLYIKILWIMHPTFFYIVLILF
jgi:hypothetical protein